MPARCTGRTRPPRNPRTGVRPPPPGREPMRGLECGFVRITVGMYL